MNILGLSGGFHDAAATVITPNGEILFAAHSERYSNKKEDPNLDQTLLDTVFNMDVADISWYERPWLHNMQLLRSGNKSLRAWTVKQTLKNNLGKYWNQCSNINIHNFPHHLSHAAAAFQTSPFNKAAVVVIDAVGELDTISIYLADYDDAGKARYRKCWQQKYPHSIGLFYSAITKQIGLNPMEEEYITMGMSAYGSNSGADILKSLVIDDLTKIKLTRNLHLGFDPNEIELDNFDMAASGQYVLEQMIDAVMLLAKKLTGQTNLAYGGGVALNCLANSRILGKHFDNIWIMPSPGDAGSSLGAAALVYGKKIKWKNAFLGHCIEGPYPVKSLITQLIKDKIAAVASGRAEFGPRALGNRSLLADPRGIDIKDRVNEIKQRQKFRPFAPMILAEMAEQYFDIPKGWHSYNYMQVVAKCRRPDLYPAVSHVDGTSRIQTVENDGSGIRTLLEEWYKQTGCPMLLNTSLNIRGMPMINTSIDVLNFQKQYSMLVHS
jgi:carbamoyltransferase